MSLSPFLDGEKKRFVQFVESVAQEPEIPYQAFGQTTWKRPEVGRGLEADESYYFQAEKIPVATAARARRSRSVADYPNPDLGIEVDISPSRIDGPRTYAALQVAEVWRYEGETEQVVIERLGEDGSYHAVEASTVLPVRAEEVRRWIIEENSSDQSAWARRLRAWARAELAPRLPR